MKAVLFDFDGTLADTLPLCYKAFQHVFETFDQRSLSEADIRGMFGPSETGIIRDNLENSRVEEAIEAYYDVYEREHAAFVQQEPALTELVQVMKEQGWLLGIVTGKAQRSLDLSLDALGLREYIDVEVSGDDVATPKPHPEGLELALNQLGVAAHEAVYVGDSDADFEAGARAGMKTIGVRWLPGYEPAAWTQTPDFTCDSTKSWAGTLAACMKA
ncbi:HAD family hydrolase [Alkalicoccus chagannorensis]|uniref:HAD family hydrolase n=1 Tax=Alkalicoccus chagannorensis TaxID=427072 RepID=UPI000408D82E|nr:HAD family hydrolase [Alkalicoccus chagannorensis]